MIKFEKKFLEHVQTNALIKPEENLLIGLSGGPDSMALLHLLLAIKDVLNIKLFAAHCNFKLRGEESDSDAKFCQKHCEQLQVSYVETSFSTIAYAVETGQSIETAARELRYGFFDEKLKTYNLDRLITAHHANDNAETILFNLFRGSSLLGLKGIPLATDKVVRPLLFFQKSEIMAYIKQKDIPYCWDSTNDLIDADRNFIRLKIIPLIESRFQHKLIPNLTRLSENGRELESFLEQHIQNTIQLLRIEFSQNQLSVTSLNKLSVFEKKEIFKRWLKYLGLDPNAKRLAQLCNLLETQPGRKVVLTKHIEILWKGKWLKMLKTQSEDEVKEDC